MKNPSPTGNPDLDRKYQTVLLASEAYGFPAARIRDIIRVRKITPVPPILGHVKGVVNLHGRVISVVDLRAKFGLPTAVTDRTSIVEVRVTLATGHSAPVGLVVDAVEAIVALPSADLNPPPKVAPGSGPSWLLGTATVGGRLAKLLDIDRIIAGEVLPSATLPALRP